MKLIEGTLLNSPSKSRIDGFEMFHRIKFPLDFINLINSANGALLQEFNVFIDGQYRLVERFLCLLDELSSNPDQGQYEMSVVIAQIEDRLTDDDEQIGTKLIPFAAVYGGDFLCLDFRINSQMPPVVLWDHNESDELEPITYNVCDSISVLLENSRHSR